MHRKGIENKDWKKSVGYRLAGEWKKSTGLEESEERW